MTDALMAKLRFEHWLGKEDVEEEVKNEDPNKSITRWLTNASIRLTNLYTNADRIRLKSKHQHEFIENYEWYGSPFGSGNPGYTFAAHLHAVHSISIDGEGRREAVVAMAGMNEPEFDAIRPIQNVNSWLKARKQKKLRTFDEEPDDGR